MINNVHTKTISEVFNNRFSIICFSDYNENSGDYSPVIFKSEISNKNKIIDNVEAKEGELLISSIDDNKIETQLDSNGNLLLDSHFESNNRYKRGLTDDAYLIHEIPDNIPPYSEDYGNQYKKDKKGNNNTLKNVGDVLLVNFVSKITGRISIKSFDDELIGANINSEDIKKEYKVSVDNLFWSDWKELNSKNLSENEIVTENCIYFQIRYTKLNSNETNISFKEIRITGDFKKREFITPTLSSSIFNNILGTEELSNLEKNVFKKLYFRGIIPTYIERADNNSYKEDKDFIDLFFSISRFFSIIVCFFKCWENFDKDKELLREQVRGYGIYFNESNVTLEELQYIAKNIYSQIQQRGTAMIFSRKGDLLSNGKKAEIDGEFIRLVRLEECDEMLYEKIPNYKVGWCMNNSSPLYKGTSNSYFLNKTKESGKDFNSLSNFNFSKTEGCSYEISTDNDKKILNLSTSPSGGTVGLGRINDDEFNHLYNVDSQIDYEITFAFKISNKNDFNLIFGVEGFDKKKDKLANAFISSNRGKVSENFFNQNVKIWKKGIWYYVRGIIYAYSSKESNNKTNLGIGNNLTFNNSFVKYILPKIQISSVTESEIKIWDYKIRPLVRGKNIRPLMNGESNSKSLGFIQGNNFSHTYVRINNNNQSQEEITDIIKKYLYPYNTVDIFTIMSNYK